MRAVILTNRQGNQLGLINKLAPHVDIAAVVFSRNVPRRPPPLTARARVFVNRAAGRFVGRQFRDVWKQMLARYSETFPNVPVDRQVEVENVNDDAVVSLIDDLSPDLVLVSGTNIVGRRVIETAKRHGRLVNLHTGISPYVKGGPNCTNWCLAKGWYHLIGNTVMWLDTGIDTGNIIATERTPLDGREDLFELHWKVMEHGHDLYVRAVKRLAAGHTLADVPQKKVAEGKLFLTADWGPMSMRLALVNFETGYRRFFSESSPRVPADIDLFPLPDDQIQN